MPQVMDAVRLPYPHSGQQRVRRDARRFNWLCAGRRWRKTTLVLSIAVEAALQGQRVIWGAPVYDQVRVAWNETRRAVGGVANFSHSRMEVTFPRGGTILYRSLDDPDNARGHTADGVVLDEAAGVKEDAWYEVLRPMLLDTAGWMWAISTPKGHNWFWREQLATADRSDSTSWHAPTVGATIADGVLVRKPHPLENPAIAFEEIQALFATTPERIFRQEVLAEYIEDAGAIFRNVRSNIVLDREPDGPVFVGVDLGRTTDATVFTALCGGHVLAQDRFTDTGWEVQFGRLHAFCARHQPRLVLIETNFNDMFAERAARELSTQVEGFRTTAQSKRDLIDALALGIETGEVTYPELPQLVNELEAFEYRQAPSGQVRMAAPLGVHDDCVISLALAHWAATRIGYGYGSMTAAQAALERAAARQADPQRADDRRPLVELRW